MKLFHISQDVNNGYDTYSDAVVAAETEDEARKIHPSGEDVDKDYDFTWTTPDNVQVSYLGEAAPNISKGVICASFHAG